ncbi:SDR family NAD(P)-dependent oxidoreductase [Christensenella timonensis]|uniref:SDR family NAD(P)-dependent oxidoreductase n=1 Tax=Christensenella timonensis TaxID=1816678 RepID=UPI00082CDDA6|nr:SDR family oxidoreductase [Christensenella timonensis]
MRLNGKVIMVTGAAGGIGKATAKICAGYGAKVIAVDMKEDGVRACAQEIINEGGEAIALSADVRKRETVKKAVEAGIAKFGKIDGLFNNAGVVRSCPLVDCSDEEYDFTMDINTKGSFIVATEVAKTMIPNRSGRIISTSSISAFKEEATNGTYCMSKAAIAMMMRVMALELGQYNISCLSIAPGHINTGLLRGSFEQRGAAEGKSVDEFYEEMQATIPLGRLAEPEEIGEIVAFLFDDRSAYIDGNNILMAGGKIMG